MSAQPLHLLYTNKKRGWGGEPLMALELATRMAKRGHRVTLAAILGSEILRRLPEGSGVEVLPLTFRKGFPRVLWTLWREGGTLARYVRAERVSVVHTVASFDTWVATIGLRSRGVEVPIVRTKHNLKPIGVSPHNRWYYRRGVRCFIAPSQAVYEHLLASHLLDADRVRYIPNGISLDGVHRFEGTRKEARAQLELPAEGEVVVYVSRLSARKEPALLARACKRLAARRSGLRLVIAGDGNPGVHAELEAIATGCPAISLLGFRRDVGRVLAAADVFCLPSRTEPFGLAPLEAMLNRVPVVLSDADGFRDYARDGENALVFPRGDEDALMGALERALSDGPLRARLVEAGERTVRERFNVERMVDETEKLYRELAGAGEPSLQ